MFRMSRSQTCWSAFWKWGIFKKLTCLFLFLGTICWIAAVAILSVQMTGVLTCMSELYYGKTKPMCINPSGNLKTTTGCISIPNIHLFNEADYTPTSYLLRSYEMFIENSRLNLIIKHDGPLFTVSDEKSFEWENQPEILQWRVLVQVHAFCCSADKGVGDYMFLFTRSRLGEKTYSIRRIEALLPDGSFSYGENLNPDFAEFISSPTGEFHLISNQIPVLMNNDKVRISFSVMLDVEKNCTVDTYTQSGARSILLVCLPEIAGCWTETQQSLLALLLIVLLFPILVCVTCFCFGCCKYWSVDNPLVVHMRQRGSRGRYEMLNRHVAGSIPTAVNENDFESGSEGAEEVGPGAGHAA